MPPDRSERPYGRRARIGLIVPSANTVNETEFWRMAPDGVTIHTTRLLFRTRDCTDPLADMESHMPRVLEELRTLEVDVVAYGCTASSLRTPPETTAHEIQEALGIPAVTTMGAVLAAFAALGVRRIAVGSPYPDTVNAAERRFFEGRGLAVTRDEGLILREDQHQLRYMNLVPVDAVERFALSLDTPDTEAVFLSCTDMASLPAIEPVERALGKPVVTSTQATFWQALRAAGIDDRLAGCGRLPAEH